MGQKVFAIGCHPDDIEFMMAGTLFLLKEAGCEVHYLNVANGSCGSLEYPAAELIKLRREEGIQAAAVLGASYHESLVNDLEVFYQAELIQRLTAIIRRVAPDIVLIPSLEDYMEDHMNTARVAVTAAFCKGMPNYPTIPATKAIQQDVTLYHALPWGLRDGMRRRIVPELYVDVSSVMEQKKTMLVCHASQRNWLDDSQGVDHYVTALDEMGREVGRMSGRYEYAEGWRRHSHLGYSEKEIDPLFDILKVHSYQ